MPVFLSPLDLAKNELQNPRLQNLGTAPSSPVVGQLYLDTAASLNLPRVWNGSAWMLMGGRLDQLAAPTSAVAMNSQQITGLADPSGAQHAATQNFVVTRKITDLAAPTSAVSFNSQQITNLLDPSAAQHAATQNYVLTRKVTDLTAPTASFSMNNQKITSLATPTANGDAAEYAWVLGQVENARQAQNWKAPVRVRMTTNVTVASPGATLDGVTMAANDRVLLMGQSTGSENGIYVWAAAASPMTRATDADVFGEVQDGTYVPVREGTGGDTIFRQIATLTSFTGQSWVVVSSGGGTYTAGAGMTESSGTFNVVAGAGTGLTVNADNITNDWSLTARKMTGQLGNGSLTAITVTHNWGTRAVNAEVYRATTPWDTVWVDMTRPDTNSVTFTFASAPTTNQFEYVLVA